MNNNAIFGQNGIIKKDEEEFSMKGCMTNEVEFAALRREQGIKPRTRDQKFADVLLSFLESKRSDPSAQSTQKRRSRAHKKSDGKVP